MKRFNLFRFVFALVFGCHINGVKSQTCNAGYYLDPNGTCKVLPYDDQSIVGGWAPRHGRCGAFDTTLEVRKYEYTTKVPGWLKKFDVLIKHCKGLCLFDRNCTHFEFDENNKKCSLIGKESFGTKDKNVVSGYGECPKNDKCQNFGIDFVPSVQSPYYPNVSSPKDCQKLCRRKDSPTVFTWHLSDKHSSYVRRDCYCAAARSFDINPDIDWISGDSRCPPCFFYYIKLRNLPNVDNGGPNPYLIKPTVRDCQRSCKDNPNCTWFEFNRSNNECRHKNDKIGEMMKKNVGYGSRDCNCDCNKNGVHGCSNDDVCHCKPGYQGPKCDQCVDEYYMPDRNAKKCYPCNCSTTGTRNLSCDRTGQCNCYEDSYTGLKCNICVKGQIRTNRKCCWHNYWYDWSKRDCIVCNCHSVGSKSQQCSVKSGQCPCISKEHSGRKCDGCVPGKQWSNGHCCLNNEYYREPNKKGCSPCACHEPGSKGKDCAASDGQCTCKGPYKGRRCDDVNAVETSISQSYHHTSNRYYAIFEHYCNGNCDVRDLRVKTKHVDVDIHGSPLPFKADLLSDDSFCDGISGSKKGDYCKFWKSQLSVDKFYVLLVSTSNFGYLVTYKVKVGNYKGMKNLGKLT